MKALLLALAALSAGSAVAGPADTLAVGSDIAEIVERLGASEHLLGRDDSSAYPADIARLPSIGYMRQLSAEAVLSLHPRRLLVSDAARPAIVLRQLRAVGLDVVEVPRGRTVEAIPQKIALVARTLGVEAAAEPLLERQRQALAALRRAPSLPGKRALFIFNHAGMTPLVMGRGSEADAAMRQAGIDNAASFEAYKQVASEAMVALAPDFVIIGRSGLEALGGEDNLWRLGGLALTPAGRARRLVVVDEQALLNLGPRTVESLLRLNRDAGALFP
ncbi:TPA: ABC transporter substrate-binding protein [Pseudomonas aeruginosa]|nr:ABC transporter substrate-binding protein [Pseudomonas aeruginosa]